MADANINPIVSEIFEGRFSEGNQPASSMANGFSKFVVAYKGLTQDTAYHVYCAQGGLITRMAYFRTRSAYCSVQPIGVREIDRRFYFSHPAIRFTVAGTPIYERDPPSCSIKYKNSILLAFPEKFPPATGRETLRLTIGGKIYTYKSELYEKSDRIDATNALVFKEIIHGIHDVSSPVVLEIFNISTAIEPGLAGKWKVLICDYDGWEISSDKTRYRGEYMTPSLGITYYEVGDIVSHNNKLWELMIKSQQNLAPDTTESNNANVWILQSAINGVSMDEYVPNAFDVNATWVSEASAGSIEI